MGFNTSVDRGLIPSSFFKGFYRILSLSSYFQNFLCVPYSVRGLKFELIWKNAYETRGWVGTMSLNVRFFHIEGYIPRNRTPVKGKNKSYENNEKCIGKIKIS